MVAELCAETKNYFHAETYKYGTFDIVDGQLLSSDFLQDGQYFHVVGSVFNDGVHKKGDVLTDESFHGCVYPMAVPVAFVKLADEVKAYCEKNDTSPSAFTSESFGAYSYSKATDENGLADASWQKAFARKLNRWRKI